MNKRPAIRLDDPGIHTACCGLNRWTALQGSMTVFINGKPAVRIGDQTRHCGGVGQMIEGSPNVIVGGPPGTGTTSAGGGGGGGGGGGSGGPGASADAQARSGSGGGSSSGPAAGGGAPGSSASSADPLAPLKPEPLLIAARWSVERAAPETTVTLRAMCEGMAGKPASFAIADADDPSKAIASVRGTCSDTTVEATWQTPSSGPPSQFTFEVRAGGKEASSNVLTLVRPVELGLVLDGEPAKGIRVRLRVMPSGEQLSGQADDKGRVRFEDAPLGDYTLLLED